MPNKKKARFKKVPGGRGTISRSRGTSARGRMQDRMNSLFTT